VNANPPLLQLNRLCREYPAGEGVFAALKDLDLTIEAGEFVAIVGASGSGKSTLMNILGCLDRPTRGSYYVGGQDTATLDADALAALRRERVGFIFQRYNLLSDLSALENVEVPAVYAGRRKSLRRERAHSLLTRLGLADRLNHHPSQLSGGQQQRVSIARALMNGGDIILADEPTGALDSHVGEEVLAILAELHSEGHTVILVTHDHKVAANAQRIIELSDGRMVADRRTDHPANRFPAGERLHVLQTKPSLTNVWGQSVEALRMALVSMTSRRLRTLLTMLGIIIGIASVASVVALGRGGQERILASIRVIGTNTVDVYPGKDWGDENAVKIRTLLPSDAIAIAQQGHIDSVTPAVAKSASLRFSNVSVDGMVNGVGENYFRVHGIEFSKGQGFRPADVVRLAQTVVIDENARKALFQHGEEPLGKVILLGNVPFRVSGVTKEQENMGYLGVGLNVWAPYTAVMGRMLGQQHLKSISARVRDDAPVDLVADVITRLLVTRHGRKDFFIFNTDTIRKSIESTTATMKFVVASIATVSLLVGGIGVMNIMLVSVTERTREIGIRAAVGARRRDILRQFLIEAVIVCLIGGMLGVLLAFAVSFAFSRVFTDFPMVFSTFAIVAAVVVSCAIGVVFGFVPARRAAYLDPIEALARE
jgi:macrolide transport system ATP-binding/permease protein